MTSNIPNYLTEPGEYPTIDLLGLTVFLETAGEPWEGKLAVAYNPCNRALLNNWTIHKAILGPDERAYDDGRPYEIYSCWNDNERDLTRTRIQRLQPTMWNECLMAATSALYKNLPDPSHGAYFYLNEEVTRKLQNGKLPGWWDSDADAASEVKIGRHTFRRRKW